MNRASLAAEKAAVRVLCRQLGLGDTSPALLKAAHHTALLIRTRDIVARVQSVGLLEEIHARAKREVAVARHLAEQDAPVVAPLAEGLAGPHVAPDCVVTLWHYERPIRRTNEADAKAAAEALNAVHGALRNYPVALPPYTQALDRCTEVLEKEATQTLADGDRALLALHLGRLRQEIERAKRPWQPLHGDIHLGNLVLAQGGPAWTDFEDACRGPREHDIAGLPAAAWPLFVDVDPALIRIHRDLKSVCVAIWCWADVGRSREVREAANYHLHRVRRLSA